MSSQTFQILNPNYVELVEEIFAKQGLMALLDASLSAVSPGHVIIEMPSSKKVTQQHGFIHAGVLTSIVDTACGAAAATLMPPRSNVLTIEYKVNFLSPARGVKAIAVGRVLRPGSSVTVCQGEVFMADSKGKRKLCATMLATMIGR